MRSTISWIKQTVLLAYQSSNCDTQDLQVKAHDVRSMHASLAFKGGGVPRADFRLLFLEEPQHLHFLLSKRCVLAVYRPNRLQIRPSGICSVCG